TVDSNNLSGTNVGIGGSLVGNLTINDNTGYATGFLALLGEAYNLSFARNVGAMGLTGIEVDGGTNISLEGNRYTDSVVGGFRLSGITGGKVDGNLASGGYPGAFGIELSSSSALSVTNSTLSNCSVGLEIDNSTRISAVGNTLGADNSSFTLLADGGVLLYHNNFEADRGYTIAASAGLSFNAAYPVGGNFWSNYTSADTRSDPVQKDPGPDNIVDQPFLARGGVDDAYPLASPWSFPVVQFLAHGLPASFNWSISVTFLGAGSGTSNLSGGAGVLNLSVPYGARIPFDFRVGAVAGYVPTPRAALGNTSPALLVVTINFAPFLAPVRFHEGGLAAGTTWSVTADGRQFTSTTAWVNLSLANGSYAYAIPAVGGYNTILPGIVVVTGSTVSVLLNFSTFDFEVTFLEYGLANGTPWTLTLLGNTFTQTSRDAYFQLPNGSYPFGVNRVAGYLLLSKNGTLTVAGRAVALQIAFGLPPAPPPPPPPPATTPLLEYLLAGVAVAALVLGWGFGRRNRGTPEAGEHPRAPPGSAADAEGPSAYDDEPP
ncbi:MAG: right-handed parallel beta-helix repeat-containing protein, partial [Thermoplasmata archaeon]|nr:right-handed parallel beta-helix repeat-containing protein [Thermoplasmata archaeon]